MKITEQLDRTLDDLLRATHALPSVLHSMRDAMGGQPRAQNYDTNSSVPVLYCERHEGDLADCPEETLCTGRPVDVQSDPTGDAGVAAAMGKDLARKDHRELQRLTAQLAQIGDRYVGLVARWQKREANTIERKATEKVARECEVCARSNVYVAALVGESTAHGSLDRPYRLCRWHHDFATDHRRLPFAEEEKQHQAGKRVVVRVRQTDRLRRGIQTGHLDPTG